MDAITKRRACAIGMTLAAAMAASACRPSTDPAMQSAAAVATQDVARTGAQAMPDNQADQAFYNGALQSGIGEVALSEYARANASAAEVRELAVMLARDHRALNDELRRAGAIADDPMSTEAQRSTEARLRSLRGTAFDAAWLAQMAQGHAQSIARFQAASRDAQSEATRLLASRTLPTLQRHSESIAGLMRREPRDATPPKVVDDSVEPTDDMPPDE